MKSQSNAKSRSELFARSTRRRRNRKLARRRNIDQHNTVYEQLEDRRLLAVTLDTSFGDDGIVTTNLGTQPTYDYAQDVVAVQADGKTLVAGHGGPNDFIVARYNTDGSLDTSFDSDGKVTVDFAGSSDQAYALALDTNGKIVAAGRSYTGSSWDFSVARLNSDGSLDTSFDSDGKATIDFGGTRDYGYDLAMAADGKIIVAGQTYQSGNYDFAVARLNADGTLDTSFDSDGRVTLDFGSGSDFAYGVATDASGKVVVAGYRYQAGYDFAVARFNTDGSLDTTFDGDGRATIDFGFNDYARDVAIDSNGKIVLGGHSYQGYPTRDNFAAARLNANGSLDTSFSGDGKVTTDFSGNNDQAYGVAVADNGDVILVGRAYQGYPTYYNFALARYDSNGNLDGSFGTGGKVTTDVNGISSSQSESAYGVAFDASGNIIVAGESHNSLNNTRDITVARYAANGTLDQSFDGDGIVQTDIGRPSSEYAEELVALQPDGKILVLSRALLPVRGFAIVRYNVDGSIDSTFGTGGTVTDNFGGTSDYARALTVDANGKIVVAGQRYQYPAGYDFAVARFNADGSIDTSFDGDGKATFDFSGSTDQAYGVAVDSSGKIVVAGARNQSGVDFAVARLNTDGSLDSTFDGDGKTTIDFGSTSDRATDVAIDANGKIVIGGYSYQGSSTQNDFAVARLNPDGSLDSSFDGDGRVTTDVAGNRDYFEGLAIDAAGKIVATGEVRSSDGDYDFGLVRYNDDGSLDTSFDGDGIVTSDFSGGDYDGSYDIVVDGSGKYVVGGETYDTSDGSYSIALARYNTDGTLDTTFDDGDGMITIDVEGYQWAGFWRLAIDPAGRIIAGGWAGSREAGDDIILARYTTNQPPTIRSVDLNAIEENSVEGTSVGQVVANDPDNDTLAYTIADSRFEIDSSGNITVAAGATLDYETETSITTTVTVSDGTADPVEQEITIELLNVSAVISGTVFVDANGNGLFDNGADTEIDGVFVELFNAAGNTLLDSDTTELGGVYAFEVDDEFASYLIRETQPTGVDEGAAMLGDADGNGITGEVVDGTANQPNEMQLTLTGIDAEYYDFTETGQAIEGGDTATIGFWQNKNGQKLIKQGGDELAGWLTENFRNVFGETFVVNDSDPENIIYADAAEVADFYKNEFFKKKLKGTAKVDAQFMSTAFATFFTSSNLSGGSAADSYGFNVTETGIGTKVVNVGSSGAAFGVDDDTDITIMAMLLATNSFTGADADTDGSEDYSHVYDANGDGVLDEAEKAMRAMANELYSWLNETGDI